MRQSLESWLQREYRYAATAMLESVSPVTRVKRRTDFGQCIIAQPGAIVASPVCGAAYDPDPDYYFHWYRDSALVIDALRQLAHDGLQPRAREHFADFVRFSAALGALDGRRLIEQPAWRRAVRKEREPYLRSDAELAHVRGDAVAADTRVNPDGTLDILKWARPQHDGPALRALAVVRWLRSVRLDPAHATAGADLLRADLEFTLRHARKPCFDIWEEEYGAHYYTLRLAAAALDEGAEWLDEVGERGPATDCRAEAGRILEHLETFWDPDSNSYRSRILASGERSARELDISVVLAAVHARGRGTRHTSRDPRMQATLERLERLFAREYLINRTRPPAHAPAMGRYPDDRYYSGGAYYFATLAAAELCFRAAASSHTNPARTWFARGDAFLRTVRAYTPTSGELSEQFDRASGEQTSAKRLAWSYAAFITCAAARRALQDKVPGS